MVSNVRLYLLASLLVITISTSAQVPGLEGLNGASSDVRSLFYPIADLIMIMGALVGLGGGLRVFTKWNSGDRHVERDVMGWFGACIFLELVSAMMKGMFL